MNNLIIAAQLSSLEDSIKALTEQFVILKQSISELNTDDANDETNDEVNEPMDESTSERTRDDLVKDVLKLTAELGWTRHTKNPKGKLHYWFSKGDNTIPIILENHNKDKKADLGYLTTMKGTDGGWYKWSDNVMDQYNKNINSLDWVSYGGSSTRKRLDPINMSNEQIKDILKRFETIHI